MNSKNTLVLALAIMLIVSQLVGEDSTIAKVATSNSGEAQQLVGPRSDQSFRPANVSKLAHTPPAQSSPPAIFANDEPAPFDVEEQAVEPDTASYDSATESEESEVTPAGLTPEQVEGVPFDPRIR